MSQPPPIGPEPQPQPPPYPPAGPPSGQPPAQQPGQPYPQPSSQPYAQPYSQPGQSPYTPYAQNPYPHPYGQVPQQPNHTTRNVLLIVGGVILLFCSGIVGLVVWAVGNVDQAFDPDFPGSSSEPQTVAEGDAFEIRGFEYDEGWSVTSVPGGGVEITGLRGTNLRDDMDSASVYVVVRLFRGNEQLASVSCDAAYDIAYERSVTLECSALGDDATGYDEIEIYDDSYAG